MQELEIEGTKVAVAQASEVGFLGLHLDEGFSPRGLFIRAHPIRVTLFGTVHGS